ncbi:MAG TPA: glycosyltransferase [Acidimicrobiales bacterium]|nr:glycosyltransferase [Acidimicrobiales bacterium]
MSQTGGDRPLVSIVIATYNRWPMVGESVQSALDQTLSEREVIVVDDGSTDGTTEHVRASYPAVRVVRQENAERGVAYNHGIALARAPYVAFLDDDDVYEPWHLAQFAAALSRRPDAQVFASPAWFWDPVTGRRRLHEPFDPSTLAQDALRKTAIVPQMMVVAKSALLCAGGFPEERAVMGAEDWVLLIKLTRLYEIVPLEKPSLRIRVHAGRSVNDLPASNRSREVATQRLLSEELAWLGLSDEERRVLVAGHLYALGHMQEARSRLRRVRRSLGWATGTRWTSRLWAQTWLGHRGSTVARRLKSRVILR